MFFKILKITDIKKNLFKEKIEKLVESIINLAYLSTYSIKTLLKIDYKLF